jgi:hypothetical protein
MDNLSDKAENVRNRSDLVDFISDLAEEFEGGADWENRTIDQYLDGMGRWLQDSDGLYRNIGERFPDPPRGNLLPEC